MISDEKLMEYSKQAEDDLANIVDVIQNALGRTLDVSEREPIRIAHLAGICVGMRIARDIKRATLWERVVRLFKGNTYER